MVDLLNRSLTAPALDEIAHLSSAMALHATDNRFPDYARLAGAVSFLFRCPNVNFAPNTTHRTMSSCRAVTFSCFKCTAPSPTLPDWGFQSLGTFQMSQLQNQQ